MIITGTHIHYYFYCKRKLWLSLNNISMEDTSSLVMEGKLVEETTFKRRSDKNKQILLGSIKVDYIDDKNKVLYETKKSSKNNDVSKWQMKYYLFVLKNREWKGIIEVPTEKKKIEVLLEDNDIIVLSDTLKEIEIINSGKIPNKIDVKKCLKCSFYDFCYS